MGNCLPWGSGPEGNGNVIAYRDDAGWFEAVCRVDEDGEDIWFTAGGEDLTGDLPTSYFIPTTPDQAATDDEIIRKFARLVLDLYIEYPGCDIDGGDMHEIMVSSGLAVPGIIDQADIDAGWPGEWDLNLGDPCEKFTPLAMKRVRMEKDGTDGLHKEQG